MVTELDKFGDTDPDGVAVPDEDASEESVRVGLPEADPQSEDVNELTLVADNELVTDTELDADIEMTAEGDTIADVESEAVPHVEIDGDTLLDTLAEASVLSVSDVVCDTDPLEVKEAFETD